MTAAPPVATGPGDADRVFKALADPNRRAVLRLVRDRPRPVGEVATAAGVSQQVASHHLRVLARAGLAERTAQGTRHLYAVRTDTLAAVRGYLEDFWPDRLRALKQAVESGTDGRG